MQKDSKILQSPSGVKFSLYNFSLILLSIILINSCSRENPTQPVDDGLPPAIPQQLSVYSAIDGWIGIEWLPNSEPDIIKYNIYRSINDTNNFNYLSSTSNSYFIDDTLNYDSTYYYCITAMDDENLESNKSQIVYGKPVNYYKPYRPQALEINGRNWGNGISIELHWAPTYSSDVAGYEIYRSSSPDFQTDSTHFHDFTTVINYSDTTNIQLLQNYFYKIVAVDKGGLKSSPAGPVGDLIYDKPYVIFPANNSHPDNFEYFKIFSCGRPAIYKLVIKTNPYYGVVVEEEIESQITSDTLEIPFNSYYVENYKTYYWQVFVYSGNSNEPNTFTDMTTFAIYPKP